MRVRSREFPLPGLALGALLAIGAALLVGQAASTPVKSSTEYFVTTDAHGTHLWAREGAKLRCVGHGECTSHEGHEGHDHHEGNGHGHGEEPKKP
jgi:hypothetical protein